jgi:hypothetical protein
MALPDLSFDAVGHTLAFKCRRNDQEKSRLLDRVAAVELGGLHGPAFPQTPTEAGPCSVLLTLSEPAAVFL